MWYIAYDSCRSIYRNWPDNTMLNPLISCVPVCQEISKLLLYYLWPFLSTQERVESHKPKHVQAPRIWGFVWKEMKFFKTLQGHKSNLYQMLVAIHSNVLHKLTPYLKLLTVKVVNSLSLGKDKGGQIIALQNEQTKQDGPLGCVGRKYQKLYLYLVLSYPSKLTIYCICNVHNILLQPTCVLFINKSIYTYYGCMPRNILLLVCLIHEV